MPQASVRKQIATNVSGAPLLTVGKIDNSGNFVPRVSLPPVKELHYADWLHPHTMHRYVLLESLGSKKGMHSVKAYQIKPSASNLKQQCDSCVYYHKHTNELCGGNTQLTLASLQSKHTRLALVQFRTRTTIIGCLRDIDILRSGSIVSLVQILVQVV